MSGVDGTYPSPALDGQFPHFLDQDIGLEQAIASGEAPETQVGHGVDIDGLAPADEIVVEAEGESSAWQRTKAFMGTHKWKIAFGAFATSTAASVINNPVSEVASKALEATAYGVAAGITSEAAFITGAVIMAGAVGKKIGNPFRINREKLVELAAAGNKSRWFKAGLLVNTIGAYGTGAAIAYGSTKLPAEMAAIGYSFAAGDIALTFVVRGIILDAMRNAGNNESVDDSIAP